MQPDKDRRSKSSSFWGMVFSITLHIVLIGLIIFWGIGNTRQISSSNPINVSLSNLDLPEVKKTVSKPDSDKEPVKKEKKPQTKHIFKEDQKKLEEKEAEPIKKVEKKIALETKKEEKPKPTKAPPPKPKPTKKPTPKPKPKPTKAPLPKPKPTKKPEKKDSSKEIQDVLKDIKRKQVLKELKKGSTNQDREVAVANISKDRTSEDSSRVQTGSGESSGSLVSPVIVNIFKGMIHDKISQNWRIPPNIPTDGSLEALILFKVDENGVVRDVKVKESSGNRAFDDFCVRAIYKSSPLPPPPPELKEVAGTKGVIVPFKNEVY